MAFYQFRKELEIKAPLDEVWKFISSPGNLKEITPNYMGFDITSKNLPEQMYEGMLIRYMVSPIFGIKMTWVTEITKIDEGHYFIDEQRIGPYKIWHHQHFLEPIEGGTLMKDIVSYQPPFGILGRIANKFVIQGKLEEIFNYRRMAVLNKFGKMELA